MDTIEKLAEKVQKCVQNQPVIVLGSGASVPYEIPGMGMLAQHLKQSATPSDWKGTAIIEGWQSFLTKIDNYDLESALSEVNAAPQMTEHIVETTWSYLNSADLQVFYKVVLNRQLLALRKLFEFIFSSTAKEINVITPNYDRLAEYAAEAAGFCAFTGFSFGYLGSRNNKYIIMNNTQRVRTVNVWKVHGSLGWFFDNTGTVVALPPMQYIPNGLTPCIITPGLQKYQKTHDEPFRSVMQRADNVTETASAFLCIGYGFNDNHLQPKLIERCRLHNTTLVLITKSISETARIYFNSGGCRNYLAIEEADDGIRYFSNECPSGIFIRGKPYWQLETFINLFT